MGSDAIARQRTESDFNAASFQPKEEYEKFKTRSPESRLKKLDALRQFLIKRNSATISFEMDFITLLEDPDLEPSFFNSPWPKKLFEMIFDSAVDHDSFKPIANFVVSSRKKIIKDSENEEDLKKFLQLLQTLTNFPEVFENNLLRHNGVINFIDATLAMISAAPTVSVEEKWLNWAKIIFAHKASNTPLNGQKNSYPQRIRFVSFLFSADPQEERRLGQFKEDFAAFDNLHADDDSMKEVGAYLRSRIKKHSPSSTENALCHYVMTVFASQIHTKSRDYLGSRLTS